MKSKYFILLILIVAGILQGIRFLDKGDYFTLKQSHNFELKEGGDKSVNLEEYQKYLIFYTPESEVSQKILENLEESFKFNKIVYDKVNIKDDVDVDSYQNFIFTTDTFLGFKRSVYLRIKEKIEKNGGAIYILTNPPYSPFNKLAGIEKIDLAKSYIGYGIKFFQKFFPGLDEVEIKNSVLGGYVHTPVLSDKVDVIARDIKNTPLIWRDDFGKGSILYVNSSFFTEKINRGLMTQMIALESPWYIGINLKSKLVHLDDFPSPIPRYRDEIIYKSYGMDTGEFYTRVWWQDMKSLAQRRNLKYSAFLIGDYNNDVDRISIKDSAKISMRDLDRRGRELFIHGGELGIHGYNHNPLVFEGDIDFKSLNYYPWKNEQDIEFALTKLDDIVKELWGENIEIYSYVPPSNILGKRGKEILHRHYPKLKIISSLFYGESQDGSFITEVGRDRDIPELYLLPRFSSGFSKDDEKMWSIYSALGIFGYYSHFVHPDDILSEDRGYGKDWEQLLREFEGMLVDIEKNFPDLEPTLNYQLLEKYRNIEEIEIFSHRDGDTIKLEIKNFSSPFEIFFRVKDSKIKSVSSKKYRILGEYDRSNLYSITIDRDKFEIELEGGKNEK